MRLRLDPIRDFSKETLDRVASPARDRAAKAILKTHTGVSESLVIGIDGQWGSGKTVFLKRVCMLAEEQGLKTFYFDAFENDISEDAFVSLASSLSTLFEDSIDIESRGRFLDAAAKVGKAIARYSITKTISSITGGTLSEEFISKVADAAATADVEKAEFRKILENASDRSRAVSELREEIENLCACNGDINRFLFVIDELDRCRPSFAIEVLECVKHIFNAKGATFILGADFTMLENVFLNKYGDARPAGRYFDKFLDIKHRLTGTFGDGVIGHEQVLRDIRSSDDTSDHFNHQIFDELAKLFHSQKQPIRSWIRALEAYNFAIIQAGGKLSTELEMPLGLLASLKFINENAYLGWLAGEDVRDQIQAAFQNGIERTDIDREWFVVMLERVFDPQQTSELRFTRRAAEALIEPGNLGRE